MAHRISRTIEDIVRGRDEHMEDQSPLDTGDFEQGILQNVSSGQKSSVNLGPKKIVLIKPDGNTGTVGLDLTRGTYRVINRLQQFVADGELERSDSSLVQGGVAYTFSTAPTSSANGLEQAGWYPDDKVTINVIGGSRLVVMNKGNSTISFCTDKQEDSE